jgi:hypothetical protein
MLDLFSTAGSYYTPSKLWCVSIAMRHGELPTAGKGTSS